MTLRVPVVRLHSDAVLPSAPYAGDAGLFYRPLRRLTLAAVAANVGTKLKFLDESDPLPMAFRAERGRCRPDVAVTHLDGGGRLQAVDEIRCALRVAGRGEDRTVV